jgi:hypothetical protein
MDDLFRSLVLSMIGGGHLLIDVSDYRDSDIDIGKKIQQVCTHFIQFYFNNA